HRRTLTMGYAGRLVRQRERLYLARTDQACREIRGVEAMHAADGIAAWRWWTLAELDATAETVWPAVLADLIRNALGRLYRAWPAQSCAASSRTSPTPAVPQQRPSLSQKPGRSRRGTPAARIERRHRCRSRVASNPAIVSTPACANAANRCDVPAGPWHQV